MIRTTEALSPVKETLTEVWLSPRRLLLAAAILHLIVTMSILALGHYRVLPRMFDTNGIAISFAPDGAIFRNEAANLADDLARGQIRAWLVAISPFHVKLYSICFALLRSWLGSTILAAEPLNAFCYLAILVLVYKLSHEVFNESVGLIASATVALWPSFLLHTTQLLKDPLFLVGMLAFVLVNLRFLSRSFTWPRAFLTGVGGGLVAVFIWLARDNMGELLIATLALGGAMLVVVQVRERHFQPANVVGMTLLILIGVGVTRVIPKFRKPDAHRDAVVTISQGNRSASPGRTGLQEPLPSRNPLSLIAARVGTVRQRFVDESPEASSNIDSNVQLNSTSDLVRYLPRAAAIGFFAPFPNMWFATGNQVGSVGRLISGMETMATYVVEALAMIGLWRGSRGRRRFSVWFLWLVAAMGMISLGLVVVNVGALYRLRYVFLILLIILANGGIVQTLDWRRKKNSVTVAGV